MISFIEIITIVATLVFIVSSGIFLIRKLMGWAVKQVINKIILGSFIITVFGISFFESESIMSSLSLFLSFITIAVFFIGIRHLVTREVLELRIAKGWVLVNILNLLVSFFVVESYSIAEKIANLSMFTTIQLGIVVWISIARRNIDAKFHMKSLGVSYVIFSVAMSVIEPFILSECLIILIVLGLVGAGIGFVIYQLYKRRMVDSNQIEKVVKM